MEPPSFEFRARDPKPVQGEWKLMGRLVLGAVVVALFLVAGGCSLVHQHRAILLSPGCSQRHQKPIEGNWHVLFNPATIHDEADTGQPGIGANGRPPRVGEWRRCFSCHHDQAKDLAFYRGVYDP